MSWLATTFSLVALVLAGFLAYVLFTTDESTYLDDAHLALSEARAARSIADAGHESFDLKLLLLDQRVAALTDALVGTSTKGAAGWVPGLGQMSVVESVAEVGTPAAYDIQWHGETLAEPSQYRVQVYGTTGDMLEHVVGTGGADVLRVTLVQAPADAAEIDRWSAVHIIIYRAAS